MRGEDRCVLLRGKERETPEGKQIMAASTLALMHLSAVQAGVGSVPGSAHADEIMRMCVSALHGTSRKGTPHVLESFCVGGTGH